MAKLQDKVAIVTGASSGIGLAIARAFGREGAAVVPAGRTQAPMEEAANEISANSGRALVRRVDVRDEKQVRQLVDATVKEFGGLDIYVNTPASTTSTAFSRAASRSGATCWRRTSSAWPWAAARPPASCRERAATS